MSRLFTEEQWRAIAAVERLTEHRYTYDGFQRLNHDSHCLARA